MNNVKNPHVVLCGTIRISGIFYSNATSKGIPKIWAADLYKLFNQISGEYGTGGGGGATAEVTDDLYFCLVKSVWLTHSEAGVLVRKLRQLTPLS